MKYYPPPTTKYIVLNCKRYNKTAVRVINILLRERYGTWKQTEQFIFIMMCNRFSAHKFISLETLIFCYNLGKPTCKLSAFFELSKLPQQRVVLLGFTSKLSSTYKPKTFKQVHKRNLKIY